MYKLNTLTRFGMLEDLRIQNTEVATTKYLLTSIISQVMVSNPSTCTCTDIARYISGHNKMVSNMAAVLDESPIYPIACVVLDYISLTRKINADQFCSNIYKKRRVILMDPEKNVIIKIGIIRPSTHNESGPYVGIKVREEDYIGFDSRCEFESVMTAVIDGDYTKFDKTIESAISWGWPWSPGVILKYRNEMLKNMRKVAGEWLTGC